MDFFFLILFSLLFCFIIFLKFIKIRPAHSQKLPPGPWQLPIIGSIHHLLLSASQLPHHSLRDLANKYNSPDLMHLKLGETSLVVASSPVSAKEILKTHDVVFANRPLFTALEILTYGGQTISFAPYGDYWKQLRRICVLELLSSKRIKSLRHIREGEIHMLIRSISESSSSVINLSEKLRMLTSNILIKSAVGRRYSEDQNYIFVNAVKEALEIAGGFDLADLFPSWAWLLCAVSGIKQKANKCRDSINQILDDIIQQHVKSCDNILEGEEDLLDVLLRLQKDNTLGFELTTERIKAVILDILGAGSESSSTTLEWAMSELIRNPRSMQKAQSEVRRIISQNNSTIVVTEGDIDKMKYLHLIIKETLRLHPPGPLLLPRECQKTCMILGYTIPEKATVLINAWAIGRDPKCWEDPEEFKPERFEMTDNAIDFKGANFEFLPFGSGRRMCPGMSFGLATVELALAQLLYRIDWELPDGIEPKDLDMSENFGVVASRKSDLYLRAMCLM